MYGIIKYTVHSNLAFKINMADGINDVLSRFLLASGPFRRPLMEVSEKRHSEDV